MPIEYVRDCRLGLGESTNHIEVPWGIKTNGYLLPIEEFTIEMEELHQNLA